MIDEIFSYMIRGIPVHLIFFIIYAYFMYILFFNNGKYKVLKDIEETGKILIIALGFYLPIMGLILGSIFLHSASTGTPLPQEALLEDGKNIGFAIVLLVFAVFLPYLMKKQDKNKKVDLGVWYLYPIIFDMIIAMTYLFLSIYTLIIKDINTFYFSIYLFGFMMLIVILSFFFLKVGLVNLFELEKRNYLKGFLKLSPSILVFALGISLFVILS